MNRIPKGVTTVDTVVDVVTQLCLNRGLPISGLLYEQAITKTIKTLEERECILVVGKRGIK